MLEGRGVLSGFNRLAIGIGRGAQLHSGSANILTCLDSPWLNVLATADLPLHMHVRYVMILLRLLLTLALLVTAMFWPSYCRWSKSCITHQEYTVIPIV